MFHMASFLMYDLPPGVTAGVDAGFFVLPPLTAGGPAPTFGAGDYAAAFHDRPEVREFLRTLMSPEWGAAWAAEPRSTFMPANAAFDPEQCRPAGVDPRIGDLRVQLCETSRASVAAGEFRYDGSDLMPPEVGAGAFWQGMVDYIDQGPDSIDAVLARIEAAWPA
jgi:alpha-glucoside transport system substrate-binding protein